MHLGWRGTNFTIVFKEPKTTNNIIPKITPQMNIETIGKLDAERMTKTSGPDELYNLVLKEARFHLAEVVADLFNKRLRESFVPSQLEQSNIITIQKVTNPTKPSECKPVCLISCLRKSMKK